MFVDKWRQITAVNRCCCCCWYGRRRYDNHVLLLPRLSAKLTDYYVRVRYATIPASHLYSIVHCRTQTFSYSFCSANEAN